MKHEKDYTYWYYEEKMFIGSRGCTVRFLFYLGLDVNPTDNTAAKRLYERWGLSYGRRDTHLDGVFEYTDEQGNQSQSEDWCVDMIK